MSRYGDAEEPTFAKFVEEQEFSRSYMASQMLKKTGIPMTDIETFQYVAWVAMCGIQRMLYLCDERTATILGSVLHQTALDFQDRFVAERTGIFPPPHADARRFESPDELREALREVTSKKVSPETTYEPRGYL